MDSTEAFAMGEANRGKELKVFDWDRAAKLINLKGVECAHAGLHGDWEWTGGVIFKDGKPTAEREAYLASTWATPEIRIGDEITECYKMAGDTDGWDAYTHWPKSALELLRA